MENETVIHKISEQSSWFMKFVECAFAAIALGNCLLFIIPLIPSNFLVKLGKTFFSNLLLVQLLLGLLFAIIFSLYWRRKENKGNINSASLHAFFRGILRYWLAFSISTYGFAKIFKTQFAHSYLVKDSLVGGLSGFQLTWNYFGYSYSLAVIIGLLQIVGSMLLLFRRTTLLGAAVLLPVMINIVLINVFYGIALGAFLNSVLYSLGLTYLLALRWKDLAKIFLDPGYQLPSFRIGLFKPLLKILPVAAAFSIIYIAVSQHPKKPMTGKWKVTRYIRNSDTLKDDAWVKDPTAWTTVYIEDRGAVIFCANPYLYDLKVSRPATYDYDSYRKIIQLAFRENMDTIKADVSNYSGDKMEWRAKIKTDTVALWLSKIDADE